MPLLLQSELLRRAGFAHGFFTRVGGASRPPYGSLNFSTATGDRPEAVQENFRRAAAALGVAPERIYFLTQVHGRACHVTSSAHEPALVAGWRGDAILSSEPGVACAVRTADCPALLLGERHSGAVAAVHSGWRSTAAGVAEAALRELRELAGRCGVRRPEILAALGPHIESCCFEVGEDVAERLALGSPLGGAIVQRPRRPGPARPRVDLRRAIEAQLCACGIEAGDVDHVRGCTVCDAARFHSHRRDGPRSGRMLAAVVARPPSC